MMSQSEGMLRMLEALKREQSPIPDDADNFLFSLNSDLLSTKDTSNYYWVITNNYYFSPPALVLFSSHYIMKLQ